jgi:hypothetical protein
MPNDWKFVVAIYGFPAKVVARLGLAHRNLMFRKDRECVPSASSVQNGHAVGEIKTAA